MESRLNTSCKINFVINAQRIKADGMVTIYLSIKVDQELPIKIKLPIEWPAKFFDRKNKFIQPRFTNDPDFVAISAVLETERAKYWRVVKRLLLEDKFFSVADVVKGVNLDSKGKTIAQYIKDRSLQRQREKEIKSHTGDNHRAAATRILDYKPNDIPIAEIGKKWLNKYMNWLMDHHDMTYAGAWSHIKNIRTYIHDAQKFHITINETFKEHVLAKPESDPVWLDREDLEKLLDFYNEPSTSDENRDCSRSFLFACFTGMRISDLKRFDLSWIQENEIVFTPTKVRLTEKRVQKVHVPLIPTSQQFLKSLDGQKLVTRSDQKFNERLKIIAGLSGIQKHLTTHVARHTFATMLAIQGTPELIIAKLLGHKTTKSTMVYIHIAEQARQKEMARLQNAFSNFVVHRHAG